MYLSREKNVIGRKINLYFTCETYIFLGVDGKMWKSLLLLHAIVWVQPRTCFEQYKEKTWCKFFVYTRTPFKSQKSIKVSTFPFHFQRT